MAALQRLSTFTGVQLTPEILKQAWGSYGTKLALGSWAAFGGSHLLLSSSPIRPKLIDLAGGEPNFRIGYSALQCGILATVAWKWHKLTPFQRGPVIVDRYLRQSGWKMTSAAFRTLGVLGISESFLTAIKNPMGMNSYFESFEPTNPRDIARKWQPYGLQRISRHSQFLGYSLYALGMCMMARRNACDILLWGLVPFFSLIGALHQEMRIRPGKPEVYFKETSIFPFAAYLRGDQFGSKITTEIPPSAYSSAFIMIGAIFFFLN